MLLLLVVLLLMLRSTGMGFMQRCDLLLHLCRGSDVGHVRISSRLTEADLSYRHHARVKAARETELRYHAVHLQDNQELVNRGPKQHKPD